MKKTDRSFVQGIIKGNDIEPVRVTISGKFPPPFAQESLIEIN